LLGQKNCVGGKKNLFILFEGLGIFFGRFFAEKIKNLVKNKKFQLKLAEIKIKHSKLVTKSRI
jgi:hypothetical protein